MERPKLVNYKDEIHHPNGFIEDRYMHNEYVEDLEKYVDYLESKLKNNGDVSGSESGRCSDYDEDCKDLKNHHKCWYSSRVNINGTTYDCDNSNGWCPFIHHCN